MMIRCFVGAEVKGHEPPVVDPDRWLLVREAGPLFISEEFERSYWRLREEALLEEDNTFDGGEAIVARAFGEERLLSAHVRRRDGQPTDEARARGRATLERLGLLPKEDG